jgi:DNA-binding protein H-NS
MPDLVLLRPRQITRVTKMKLHDLKSMPTDELWSLQELITSELVHRISAEKARLEQRLRQLGQRTAADSAQKIGHARRPYPQVFPKYRNPAQPSETWAGRGKQPRWLTAQLRSGKKLDDFRIKSTARHNQTLNGGARRSREVSAS